jgi:hypothetical protein
MSLKKTTRTHVIELGVKALESISARALDLDEVLARNFGSVDEPMSAVSARLAKDVTMDGLKQGASNEHIVKLLDLVFEECNFGQNQLWLIERWIQLQMPKREDGNNFGVDVLESVLNVVKDRSNMLAGVLSELPGYYINRAQVMEKVAAETKTTGTSSKETKTTTTGEPAAAGSGEPAKRLKEASPPASSSGGGEDAAAKDGKQESVTTVYEKKEVSAKALEDFRRYVLNFDLKWFWTLRDAMRGAQDSYLFVIDIIEKNRAKVECVWRAGLGAGD